MTFVSWLFTCAGNADAGQGSFPVRVPFYTRRQEISGCQRATPHDRSLVTLYVASDASNLGAEQMDMHEALRRTSYAPNFSATRQKQKSSERLGFVANQIVQTATLQMLCNVLLVSTASMISRSKTSTACLFFRRLGDGRLYILSTSCPKELACVNLV